MPFDLKSEEDVKLYLQNLWVEYNFGCHKEKNPDACHLLGDYLESIKKEHTKAGELYKSNCDTANYMKSCHKYAKYCAMGKGMPKPDVNTACKYFEKTCSLENPDGCLMAGVILTGNYEGVRQEFDRGLNYLKKACEERDAMACHFLAGMYISGVSDSIEAAKKSISDAAHNKAVSPPKIRPPSATETVKLQKDMVKAFEYSLLACELENVNACANLSRMYELGEGVEKDKDLSNKFKTAALKLQREQQQVTQILFS